MRALGQLEAYATDLYPWLPRTDRLRFLRAYLRQNPGFSSRRRELVDAVSTWVRRRLEAWAKKIENISTGQKGTVIPMIQGQ